MADDMQRHDLNAVQFEYQATFPRGRLNTAAASGRVIFKAHVYQVSAAPCRL